MSTTKTTDHVAAPLPAAEKRVDFFSKFWVDAPGNKSRDDITYINVIIIVQFLQETRSSLLVKSLAQIWSMKKILLEDTQSA